MTYICPKCGSNFEQSNEPESMNCPCGHQYEVFTEQEIQEYLEEDKNQENQIFVSSQLEIEEVMVCPECLKEAQEMGVDYIDYARFTLGWTEQGIQVWDECCNKNLINISFNGSPVYVNDSRDEGVVSLETH